MCKTAVARPGLIGTIRAWLFGPPDPPVWRPGPRECSQCGRLLGTGDDASLHEEWCYTCDSDWFESEICDVLVDRLGRGGAVRALERLVSNVRSLT
jgi:hypothetical protein